ncbi:unnamed protein product [Parnassius mnemosyne]|uniref:Uncharacterized protein n=1 Tax=Parnassius mnemosyne TaxID=213953 RepID=A0AAV1KUV6_9NEOP
MLDNRSRGRLTTTCLAGSASHWARLVSRQRCPPRSRSAGTAPLKTAAGHRRAEYRRPRPRRTSPQNGFEGREVDGTALCGATKRPIRPLVNPAASTYYRPPRLDPTGPDAVWPGH